MSADLGLGAGGKMRQEIYGDEYGIGTWARQPAETARIEMVDALAFKALTGIEVPAPAIDAETYTRFGFPWFDLLAPGLKDIRASERLSGVRSVGDLEGLAADEPLPISEAQVVRLLQLREAIA